MIILLCNLITLCKYIINNIIRFNGIYYIEFESTENDNYDDEIECHCSLCYSVKNIILFATRHLKCKKV
jgi:hypothetical protein